jgi:hypothetical protein
MTQRFLETEADRRMLIRFIDVPEFEEYYEFNLAGEVRTKPRRVNSPICGGYRLVPAQSVSVQLVKGYPAYSASVGGKKTTVYIHRCVAKTFIPNPGGKPEINHINGIRDDFAIVNLEWCTHQENMAHAFSTGLATARLIGPGEGSPAAKLNDESVREIKRGLRAGQTKKSLANKYGVSTGTIGFIARGETWGHIEP